MKARVENSYSRAPRCPECTKETRVYPFETRSGGVKAIVECLGCEYVGEFYPVELKDAGEDP